MLTGRSLSGRCDAVSDAIWGRLSTSWYLLLSAQAKRCVQVQAIVVEPAKEAPEIVRRQMQPGKLCVMFYGPAANKVRDCFLVLTPAISHVHLPRLSH